MLWTLEPKWTPGHREFLVHHGFVGEGSASAAVFLREIGEQDARRAGLRSRPRRQGGAASRQRAWFRRQFLLNESPNRFAK